VIYKKADKPTSIGCWLICLTRGESNKLFTLLTYQRVLANLWHGRTRFDELNGFNLRALPSDVVLVLARARARIRVRVQVRVRVWARLLVFGRVRIRNRPVRIRPVRLRFRISV
jgi:hypothetical protein